MARAWIARWTAGVALAAGRRKAKHEPLVVIAAGSVLLLTVVAHSQGPRAGSLRAGAHKVDFTPKVGESLQLIPRIPSCDHTNRPRDVVDDGRTCAGPRLKCRIRRSSQSDRRRCDCQGVRNPPAVPSVELHHLGDAYAPVQYRGTRVRGPRRPRPSPTRLSKPPRLRSPGSRQLESVTAGRRSTSNVNRVSLQSQARMAAGAQSGWTHRTRRSPSSSSWDAGGVPIGV